MCSLGMSQTWTLCSNISYLTFCIEEQISTRNKYYIMILMTLPQRNLHSLLKNPNVGWSQVSHEWHKLIYYPQRFCKHKPGDTALWTLDWSSGHGWSLSGVSLPGRYLWPANCAPDTCPRHLLAVTVCTGWHASCVEGGGGGGGYQISMGERERECNKSLSLTTLVISIAR